MVLKHLLVILLALLVLAARTPRSSGEPSSELKQSYRDARAAELRAAVASSDLNRVRNLVSVASTNDCLELDEQGSTALHYAVKLCASGAADSRSFEVLKLLSSRAGCVNAADRLGRKPILEVAPLSWASRSRIDALQILLAHGADVNAQDENGATLLHQLLRSWDGSSVHWPEVVQVLVAAKVNPNIRDSAGQTPLHRFFGPLSFCTNRSGVRATTVAVAQRVFAMLVEAGADLAITDNEGTTPLGTMLLHNEPYFGRKEIILGFAAPSLSKELRINSAEMKKRPALIFLCDRGKADGDLIGRLLDLGADANRAEADGFTALHGAAWFYNYRVCELLLARGANVNSINEKGRTPLHELARSTYPNSGSMDTDTAADLLRAATVLIGHGADRRMKDQAGKTALDLLKKVDPGEPENQETLRRLKKMLR
jgi:ankyrin repeat protein